MFGRPRPRLRNGRERPSHETRTNAMLDTIENYLNGNLTDTRYDIKN